MIKEVDKNDLKQALGLVNEVFIEFVAVDYSEQGKKTFDEYLKIKYDEVFSDIDTGHKSCGAIIRTMKSLALSPQGIFLILRSCS